MATTKKGKHYITRTIEFAGYTIDVSARTTVQRATVDVSRPGDCGADPLPNGTFRMVPSGDIVSLEERNRRLQR